MASGITNTGKSRLYTVDGWTGTPEIELITEVYNASQINTLTRGGLAVAAGGNYAAKTEYADFVWTATINLTDLPNFYKLQAGFSSLTWNSLTTNGAATIKGFALCEGSDVLLVQEVAEYTPNGSNYTISLTGGTLARFNIAAGQYISDVVLQGAAVPFGGSYSLLTQTIQARLVTASADKYSSSTSNFTFATGGNYAHQTLTGKTITTNGGRVIFDAADPVWTNLTTSGVAIIGVAFTVGSFVLCYHELASSFTPSGVTATYNLPTNGVLYLGDV